MKYEEGPHQHILELLKLSISDAFNNVIVHPLEKIQIVDVQDEETIRQTKLIQAVITDEDKKDKKDNTYRAMLAKISQTPAQKLNNVMFKKMLLKFITYFYDEKSKTTEKFENFGDFVYVVLMKKYMMKKAAESRFQHLLASCIKFKAIPRVRVFGRFLGLYDGLDDEDLNFYLDCLSFLSKSLPHYITNNTDSP